MKKLGVLLGTFMMSVILMAGGNTSSTLSTVVEIPAQAGKANQIHIEKDVQLMWQDQAYTEPENKAFKRQLSIGKAGNYRHVKNYCNRLNYAGFTDWRLPTSDELTHVHSHKGQVFTYFRGNDFWSSTATVPNKYYVVFPTDAMRYARSKKQSNFVRCVRSIANDK